MKPVNLNSLNREFFKVKEAIISGEKAYLVIPETIAVDWNEDNLIFRSSIWNSEGYPVSLSFPKFFNLEEKPNIHPFDKNLNNCSLIEKIDGSTFIVSKYKGELIIRTRGTFDASTLMQNGEEVHLFKDRYSSFFDSLPSTTDKTYLFEWVSPKNTIVIKYPEPELYLINIINHYDYSLTKQTELDSFAVEYGFKRPIRYNFNSFDELLLTIGSLEDREGVCVYYNNDQNIRKVKSLKYLKLHAFKSNCNVKNLTNLYIEWGMPTIEEFFINVEKTFDFECLEHSKEIIKYLFQYGVDEVIKTIEDLKYFVKENENLSQKEFALRIKNTYKLGLLTSMGFTLRKNGDTADLSDSIHKLIDYYICCQAYEEKMSYKKATILS